MKRTIETLDLTWDQGLQLSGQDPVPGLVMVAMAGVPHATVLLLEDGALELGREMPLTRGTLEDATVSRRHARVELVGDHWSFQDLDSRNGSALDGVPFTGEQFAEHPKLLRLGNSLFLPCRDITRFLQTVVTTTEDGVVMGATLFAAWQSIRQAAEHGATVHVQGESGAGKELAARAFHEASGVAGAFVPVNCAAIPEGVAERILFGAVKGAYSGIDAAAEGFVQAADGGTLFLDEVAELDPAVQAKLLRVLENHEVTALGASRATPVALRVVSATHKDLRAQVSAGKLREDLYFRLAQPTVQLPPLRARLEEVPALVAHALRLLPTSLRAHVSLLEACLVRHWPGNVRELVAEVRAAGQLAMAQGSVVVEARHLRQEAGRPFEAGPKNPSSAPAARSTPSEAQVREALGHTDGNVSRAARLLGVHRTQLRRWIERYGIES